MEHTNNRVGTCTLYFTDSDTIKKCWYLPDIDTDASTWCSPKKVYMFTGFTASILYVTVCIRRWINGN